MMSIIDGKHYHLSESLGNNAVIRLSGQIPSSMDIGSIIIIRCTAEHQLGTLFPEADTNYLSASSFAARC